MCLAAGVDVCRPFITRANGEAALAQCAKSADVEEKGHAMRAIAFMNKVQWGASLSVIGSAHMRVGGGRFRSTERARCPETSGQVGVRVCV